MIIIMFLLTHTIPRLKFCVHPGDGNINLIEPI